jgi:hypothetical protein
MIHSRITLIKITIFKMEFGSVSVNRMTLNIRASFTITLDGLSFMLSAIYAGMCCLCSLAKGAITLSIMTLRKIIKHDTQHYDTKPNETRH